MTTCSVCGQPWGMWGTWVVSASTNPKEYAGHLRCIDPERYEREIQEWVDHVYGPVLKNFKFQEAPKAFFPSTAAGSAPF